jgi:TfoX/Sxy family transcriptional regulator of competence genes
MGSASTTSKSAVDPRFAAVARAFARRPDVTEGKLFSAYGLRVNGKIFAMFPRGQFVVKLPKSRVDELVASGNGQRFGPGARVMKEWICVDTERDWIALAREAYAYVKRGTA